MKPKEQRPPSVDLSLLQEKQQEIDEEECVSEGDLAADDDFELQQVSSDVNSNALPEFIQEAESRERKDKMVKLA